MKIDKDLDYVVVLAGESLPPIKIPMGGSELSDLLSKWASSNNPGRFYHNHGDQLIGIDLKRVTIIDAAVVNQIAKPSKKIIGG